MPGAAAFTQFLSLWIKGHQCDLICMPQTQAHSAQRGWEVDVFLTGPMHGIFQLSSVQKAHFERLEAARPRRPGSREQGPVLRMAGQQPPPCVLAALLLCLLSLGGAIEIPMDRESWSLLPYSPISWMVGRPGDS
ncbi:hypothetical protein MC885_012044 [Smutsia gigantea]|nr:hypothetical protein MC885_012044 [Smutsia gigantea]